MIHGLHKCLWLFCAFYTTVAVISCKKDDKGLQPITSGNYVFDRMSGDSSFKMYTKNGEIKDKGLVAHYKDKYRYVLLSGNINSTSTIKIQDDANAEYTVTDGSSTYRTAMNITKLQDHYEFRSKDTLYDFVPIVDLTENNLGKYKPYYKTGLLPNGNYGISTFSYMYAVTGSNTLTFPLLFAIRLTGNNSYQYGAFNIFDENFPGTLATTDTVLLQSLKIQYKTAP